MLKDYNGHKPEIHSSAFISPNAMIIGKVKLSANVSIWPGCVLRGDVDEILVGEDSNLQDGVLVHTNHGLPAIIGKGVTVGHGAILHGCRIGDNCLIGMGAIILDGAVIGDNCLIGAGALVAENVAVPEEHLVLGLPGRPVRKLSPDEILNIRRSSEEYKQLAGIYGKAEAKSSPV